MHIASLRNWKCVQKKNNVLGKIKVTYRKYIYETLQGANFNKFWINASLSEGNYIGTNERLFISQKREKYCVLCNSAV